MQLKFPDDRDGGIKLDNTPRKSHSTQFLGSLRPKGLKLFAIRTFLLNSEEYLNARRIISSAIALVVHINPFPPSVSIWHR